MSLNQTQFDGSFDGCAAAVDVEFGVDAFSVGANGAQGDHECVSDFWPGQIRLEQAQDFQLALAEWLNEGRWGGCRCNSLASGWFMPHYFADITGHDPPRGRVLKQFPHIRGRVQKHTNIPFWLGQLQSPFQGARAMRVSPLIW